MTPRLEHLSANTLLAHPPVVSLVALWETIWGEEWLFRPSSETMGIVKTNRDPSPNLLSAQIRPLCISIKLLVMNNPNCAPCEVGMVEGTFENSLKTRSS